MLAHILIAIFAHFLYSYVFPNPKLACFVLHLKIINTFLKNNMDLIVNCDLSKELKNGIEILIGQAVSELWIKTVKMLFGSITQEPLGLPKFGCFF